MRELEHRALFAGAASRLQLGRQRPVQRLMLGLHNRPRNSFTRIVRGLTMKRANANRRHRFIGAAPGTRIAPRTVAMIE